MSTWNEFYHSVWPERFKRPRTCNYCGSASPEDAMALIEDQGWVIEMIRDQHKATLTPPGYLDIMLTVGGTTGVPHRGNQDPAPTPPVKLYAAHFTQVQWNLIFERRYKILS
jgi:hypothetical protein